LLATLGIAAVAVPLSIGLIHPPKMRAQSPLTAAPMRFLLQFGLGGDLLNQLLFCHLFEFSGFGGSNKWPAAWRWGDT
jgi:hypothetical protein